ncbi:MAG: Transposase IS116/IS110/IS902 family protein [Deltaproteobacteria bacterium ADurb.Bin151]|nr:MAG: Transposase IS116/IS110/IS902 family protein [Deltaproteobacteria bacterium ADurb.Bin151]HOQ41314.1 IS110 family transposase [Smithellaceae bacterium]HPL66534.1 IS110 family transposase [Smithellaceae bacterium]
MSKSDYNRQAARRQKIRNTTLIVGVDIGNAFNALGFMNKEGNVLFKCAKLHNNREGFEKFLDMIEGLKKKHRLRDVLIGMEPTGHYWRKLAYFAKEHGYEVRFVRTTALKHHRELDESSSAKSDQRDALTIANITREGKYIDTVIEDGVLRQLRTLSKARERLLRYSVSAKNSLHAALDDYFPELHEIFWSMGSRSLWAILDQCPFPQDVMLMEVATLQDLIARSSRKKKESLQKAKALRKTAQESIGLKQIGSADRYRIQMCLEEVKRTVLSLKNVDKQLKSLLKETPAATYLMSIPGIGPLSAAVFLGELGDSAHFHNARQIVKYAGYDPQESDSGSRIGRRFISKKGRWLLRKYLFFMSMRVVVLSNYFQEYYQRKLETKNRFGQQPRRKEMLCAVAIKLIKVIFALLRDKREFEDLAPAAAA